MEKLIHELPALCERIHGGMAAKGFWPEDKASRPKNQVMALIASEAMEALEAERKGRVTANMEQYGLFSKPANVYPEMGPDLQDKIIAGNREMFIRAFEEHVKDTVADELADVMYRVFDAIGGYGLDAKRIGYMMENWSGTKNTEACISRYALTCGKLGFEVIQGFPMDAALAAIMAETMQLAEALNIPLMWHILEKEKYNATRAAKHGKLF